MPVKLAIPPRAEEVQPGVELRPVFLEDWIEALPYANPTSLQEQLAEALAAFNRSPVKPGLRFTLLELYLKPYEFLLDFHESPAAVQSIAALEKRRAVSASARLLATELACGYKIVLAEAGSRKGLFGGSGDTRTALQRAVLFLSFALLHSYDEYLPTPSRLWLELAALYRFAASKKLHDTPVGAHGLRDEFAQSVARTYKRIMLTSLVDPFHLAHGDIWRVYRAFADCAASARLERPRPVERPAGFFVVDPVQDHRPASYAEAGESMHPKCRLLDANPVLDVLREWREQAPADATDRPDRALLGNMIRSLSLPPKRHSPRERSEGRVKLASGLSAVHHFLGGPPLDLEGPAYAPMIEREPTAPGITLEAEDADVTLTGRTLGYRSEAWELVNEGPGGIGVVKRIRPSASIGVGELIGVQFPQRGDSGTEWAVGVVRWLSIGDAGDYQAGVQLLGRIVDPVSIEVPRPDGKPRLAAALAVPALNAARGASLVAPPGVFGSDPVVTVYSSNGEPVEIRPGELIESSPQFERFTFRAG